MTLDDTPLHIQAFAHLVEDQPQDYIGKQALEALKASGRRPQLVGRRVGGHELAAELSWFWPVMRDGEQVGRVTDAVWSPKPREEHRLRVGADRAGRARQRASTSSPSRATWRSRPPRSRSSTRRRRCRPPRSARAEAGAAAAVARARLDRRPPPTAPAPRGLRKAILLVERATKEAIWDCRMCGQCILHSTGLSCPMRCPKNLRNGPCGGVLQDGICEVVPEMRCVWV